MAELVCPQRSGEVQQVAWRTTWLNFSWTSRSLSVINLNPTTRQGKACSRSTLQLAASYPRRSVLAPRGLVAGSRVRARFDQAIAFGTCSFVLRDLARQHLVSLAAHDPERYDKLFGDVPRIESYALTMMYVLSAINFASAVVLAWAARCAGAIATWSEVVEGLLSWGNVRVLRWQSSNRSETPTADRDRCFSHSQVSGSRRSDARAWAISQLCVMPNLPLTVC